jgi:hypothetical protein
VTWAVDMAFSLRQAKPGKGGRDVRRVLPANARFGT